MSTKTSIKRIALVAVSALGFGLLSVVPAKAGIGNTTYAIPNSSLTVTVGQTISVPVTITAITTDAAQNDSITVTPSAASGVPVTFLAPDLTNGFTDAANGGGTDGWTVDATSTSVLRARALDATPTDATKAKTDGKLLGSIRFTADQPGVFNITLTMAGTGVTFASAGDATKTITVNAVPGLNNARLAYVTRATQLNAVSLTNIAAAPSTYPGYGSTVSAGLGDGTDDAVTAITVPVSTAILFDLKAKTNNNAWSTGTKARLFLNGSLYADVAVTSGSGALASITSPSSSGTYTASLVISGSQGSFDPSFTESIPFTLTVGAATTALEEFGNMLDTSNAMIPAIGITKAEVSGRVGVPVGFAPNITARDADATVVDTSAYAATIVYSLTLPSGAAGSILTATVAGVANTSQRVAGSGNLTGPASASTSTYTTPVVGGVRYFIPATAGTYTVTAFHDADGNGLISNGEATTSASWVISADALPSVTFTKYGSNATVAQSANDGGGQLVKISLRNGSNAWSLAANESLVLTAPAKTLFDYVTAGCADGTCNYTNINDYDGSAANTYTLTSANFNSAGDAWFNIGNDTSGGGTYAVTAAVVGGSANGATGSFTFTIVDETVYGATAVAVANDLDFVNAGLGLGVAGLDAGDQNATDSADAKNQTWTVKTGTATTVSGYFTIGATSTNAKTYSAQWTDAKGLVTGLEGAIMNLNSLTALLAADMTATSKASFSVAIPATTASFLSGTTIGTLVVNGTTARTITVKNATAAPDAVLVNPSSLTATTWSVRAAVGSSNTFTATVLDQFGNAMAGQPVTAQVTGASRNVQLVSTPLITNASGQVTFTVTDTYTATLLTSDSLVFTATGPKTGTVTINYAAYNPASTVTITGGASADIAPKVTYSYINAGTSGASGTLVKMTATVKDANGGTLPAGIPVKWAITGLTGTSAIWTDPDTGFDWSTSYTNSNGEAVTYVYAWATGTVSVTATAGAVTSATAGKINFANKAADARVVSATVNGNVITAKVVDRYGNAVEGVSLSAVRNSGVGYFSGAASSSAVGTTGTNGTVDFIMAGGAANVTIKTTTLNDGQTSSAAGQVNGTAITATSIGASLSPAGVQSVTVDVTASDPGSLAAEAAADAAAEAIDAANAATDAANLAAEAADAATVAAEEARDAADAATAAVEELSTQVATLMAALRAQITTLANTVAKIAKKVRA